MFRPLNPLLHSQLRLAVMSILMSVVEADFVYLKEKTESTSGNLSVQLDKLLAAGYISMERVNAGRNQRTTLHITPAGQKAFEEYVEALNDYIRAGK
ncbi:transcriptional regulator [uncultured Phocaeicola sp.]|jgi:DNA-binding MarR family transcriptional regulator|uniref:winged helix-turn-helix domain-containing protein n=1 Tax=uncultured Phocaeicola sp. TaxID=990718 RepID=UPI0015AFFA4F|nr:transcriptional regulator [uncultured Phocaeicola sp.]